MPLVSERVEVRVNRAKTEIFRAEINAKEKEEQQKNDMFKKMQAMAVTHEQWNPNKSMGGSHRPVVPKKAGVDATPIYDSDSDNDWDD